MQDKKSLSKLQQIVIISILFFIAILLIFVAFLISGSSTNRGRTVMIFMAGNNLETNAMIASSEIASIIPSSIDLKNTNIILYTGGTKKWHNFISSEEDAIYELENGGFKKVKTFRKSNFGVDTALTNFLNYSYKNYKTDKYDLIFWDHGLGALGSISDENSEDFLDLSEIARAFKNSPFNEKNKIETVVFRTCLNATIEVAGILYPYADYMVASQEVTMGKTGLSVLNFLNDVNIKDNGEIYGKKFITSYKNQMDKMSLYGNYDATYSIINLNKIPNLITMIDDLFSKITVQTNYNELSKIRSNLKQYGEESSNISDYDTVDLYELIDNLKKFNKNDAMKIEKYLKNDIIIYNWTTNNYSNGLSIYFPYSGSDGVKKLHLNLYDRINVSKNYKKFINEFYNRQNSKTYSFSFDLSNNTVKKSNKEFKLKLTEDQIKNYSKADYLIFRKEEDGLFMPVYIGNDAKLGKDGYVSTNITDSIIAVVDEKDNSKEMFTVKQIESSGDYKEYTVPVILNRKDSDGWPIVENGNMHLKVDKNNKVHVDEIYLVENSKESVSKSSGVLVNLKDYSAIDFPNFRYKILDENENYTENWESSKTLYMIEELGNKYHFETVSLEKNKNYYCVFRIYDVQNKTYYSNLISID